MLCGRVHQILRRNDGFPARELGRRQRQPAERLDVPVAYRVQRLAGDDRAALDQLDQELPVDQLGRDGTRCRSPRPRRPPARRSRRAAHLRPPMDVLRAHGLLGHGHAAAPSGRRTRRGRRACRPWSTSGAREPVTSWVPTPYASTGAAASEAMAYSSRSEVTTIFVLGGAQLVELLPHPVRDEQQVPGVDADGAELGPGDLDGRRARPR